jgi:monoamine oxidase
VLETQRRVGGRVLTLEFGQSDGLLTQAGPARFLSGFDRVAGFAREFGLAIAPFYPREGRIVGFRNNARIPDYAPAPDEFWGYDAPGERQGGVISTVLRSVAMFRRSVRRALRGSASATFRFRDGTQVLTESLASASGAEVRLDTTVHRIAHDHAGAHVSYATPSGPGVSTWDYVVCAVPLSIVRDLELSPPLPAAKARLASVVTFSSAIRIFLEMRRPFWRDHDLNGFAVTDTVGEVWDPNFDAPRQPAMLVCFAKDELADRLAALDEPSRLRHALSEVERVFPGAESHFVSGTSFSWKEQPWVRGGWPRVRDGHEESVRAFLEPHGRIWFAGDYASSPERLNTVEGAIESGEFAAASIIRASDARRSR